MGHVEKLVETAQNQPLVQQQVTQELTSLELRRENTQVQKTDASEESRKIKEKEREERRRQRQALRQKAATAGEVSEEGEEAPEKREPWVGHLLNIKI